MVDLVGAVIVADRTPLQTRHIWGMRAGHGRELALGIHRAGFETVTSAVAPGVRGSRDLGSGFRAISKRAPVVGLDAVGDHGGRFAAPGGGARGGGWSDVAAVSSWDRIRSRDRGDRAAGGSGARPPGRSVGATVVTSPGVGFVDWRVAPGGLRQPGGSFCVAPGTSAETGLGRRLDGGAGLVGVGVAGRESIEVFPRTKASGGGDTRPVRSFLAHAEGPGGARESQRRAQPGGSAARRDRAGGGPSRRDPPRVD